MSEVVNIEIQVSKDHISIHLYEDTEVHAECRHCQNGAQDQITAAGLIVVFIGHLGCSGGCTR